MTLVLYTWATPNGHKPHIMLEELGVPYELRSVNIFAGEQNFHSRLEWVSRACRRSTVTVARR